MSNAYSRRIAGLVLGALAAVTALPALSADLDEPPYPADEAGPAQVYREERIEEQVPPPPPPRAETGYGSRFAAGPHLALPPPPPEECRTIVKRRVDIDGDAVERRVRICDEALYPRPRSHDRRSFYEPGPGPVPPADIPDEHW